jgi:DNA-binding transcriptional MerR regulator
MTAATTDPARFLTPAEAARRLNVSPKALRLYERHGLIRPDRTAAGWRAYGPEDMARARRIVDYRTLGLGIGQITRVLDGDVSSLRSALVAHRAVLENQAWNMASRIEQVSRLLADLDGGVAPAPDELSRLLAPDRGLDVGFALPWPWDGERFDLFDIRPLTWIVGPLGSGKTRLALEIASHLPGAVFIGLDRLDQDPAAALNADTGLRERVDRALFDLADDGAEPSNALTILITAIETEGANALVIDMVEQGLDRAAQEAVALRLRARSSQRPLIMLTRSSSMLDLMAVDAGETVILCPANHAPPTIITPTPGAGGYEAVATCLASPEVRARTAGTIAWRPAA